MCRAQSPSQDPSLMCRAEPFLPETNIKPLPPPPACFSTLQSNTMYGCCNLRLHNVLRHIICFPQKTSFRILREKTFLTDLVMQQPQIIVQSCEISQDLVKQYDSCVRSLEIKGEGILNSLKNCSNSPASKIGLPWLSCSGSNWIIITPNASNLTPWSEYTDSTVSKWLSTRISRVV